MTPIEGPAHVDPRPVTGAGGIGMPKRADGGRAPLRRIDDREVKRLYEQGLSQPEIGRRLGFNSGTVCRAMQRLGLQARDARDYYAKVDPAEVTRLYVDERLGMQEIASRIGIGTPRVKSLLVEAGVRIRPFHRPPGISMKAKPRYTTVAKRMRAAIAARSGGVCEVRLHGCLGVAIALHHRKLRAQGGTNDPANLIHVCAFCHGKIHAQPARSYTRGWLVRSGDDPAAIAWGAA